MQRILIIVFSFLGTLDLIGQDLPTQLQGYKFTIDKQIGATSVKNQYKSGTCWVYSANSFFESELMRMGKGQTDLSEMFVVRAGYIDRAENYLRRQGAAAFGQGAESHDVINLIRKYGIVPKSVYSGFADGQDKPEHNEMEAVLKAIVEALNKTPDGKLSPQWKKVYTGALDGYMGTPPETFTFNGKQYTAHTYFQSLGINLDDYVPLTSYTHHPFYKPFILEVSDNWSNGQFYNIPLDDLVKVVDNAISKGFSVVWAADVSEKTFSGKEGLAVWPLKPWEDMGQGERDSIWKVPVKEKIVSQEERQHGYDELTTTDDHGMQITGTMHDQNGTKFYIVKNSWGTAKTKKELGGYEYVSEAYFRAKTMSILLHKDAFPAATRQKLGL